MTSSYLVIAQQGKNNWKRYVTAVFIIFGFYLITALPIVIIGMLVWGPKNYTYNYMLFVKNEYRGILVGTVVSLGYLAGLAVAIERSHQRKFLTLISPDSTIQWKRVLQGLGLWLGLRFLGVLICYVVIPSHYILTFNIYEWIPYTLLAIICIPIITLVRYLTFYAYLFQGMGLWLRNPAYLAIFWGLCISLMSLPVNPLAWLIEFSRSVMILWIVLKKENRQELVIGFTFADYFSRYLLFKYNDPLLRQPTVFTLHGSNPTLFAAIIYLSSLGLFYYFFFGRSQKHSASDS
jgi:uncharacterized protein